MALLTPAQVRAPKKKDLRVHRPKVCDLYFIGPVEDPPYLKVGITTDLTMRLNRLQSASPFPLKVHWAYVAPIEVEKAIHTKLAHYRMHGEWFDNADGAAFEFGHSLYERIVDRIYKKCGLPSGLPVDHDMNLVRAHYFSHRLTLRDVELCVVEAPQ